MDIQKSGLKGFINRIHLLAYNWQVVLRGTKSPSKDVALVAVDDESVTKLGRWPWPRARIAEVINEVAKYNSHLQDAESILGPDAQVFVARELTKKFEELIYTEIKAAYQHFLDNPPKGEFVLIYGNPGDKPLAQDDIEKMILNLTSQGHSTQDILEQVQAQSTMPRKDLYNLILKLRS